MKDINFNGSQMEVMVGSPPRKMGGFSPVARSHGFEASCSTDFHGVCSAD